MNFTSPNVLYLILCHLFPFLLGDTDAFQHLSLTDQGRKRIPNLQATKAELPLDSAYSKNPIKRVGHFFTAFTGSNERSELHDMSLNTTGGVWKTKFLGKQAYGVSAYSPEITTTLTRLEAKGYLESSWPQSVIDILGSKAMIAADVQSEDFQRSRKIFAEALSTKSILSQSLPGIQESVDDMFRYWSKCAETGETITFAKDISSITYAVIVKAVFGSNSLSTEEMSKVRRCTDTLAKGLFSFPITTPILSSLPFFRRYGRAMRARLEMRELLIEKIKTRKIAIQAAKESGAEFKPTGMLDTYLAEGGSDENTIIDFCVDNIILSVFAGYDTTASLSTNLILLLHNFASADEMKKIRSELNSFNILSNHTSIPGGILDAVPSLRSAVFESFRLRPVVGATFRKTTAPIVVGSVEIPANATVQWSNIHGSKSSALYPSGTQGCPLRFLHTKEPTPYLFGYGKHACPGQYLAQIEILLVMKAFLCNFEFDLVPNQNTDASIPFTSPKSGLKLKLTQI